MFFEPLGELAIISWDREEWMMTKYGDKGNE